MDMQSASVSVTSADQPFKQRVQALVKMLERRIADGAYDVHLWCPSVKPNYSISLLSSDRKRPHELLEPGNAAALATWKAQQEQRTEELAQYLETILRSRGFYFHRSMAGLGRVFIIVPDPQESFPVYASRAVTAVAKDWPSEVYGPLNAQGLQEAIVQYLMSQHGQASVS